MNNRKVRVAITHGDTNGIGYELIFKTFAEPDMLEMCTPIIYGSPKVATYHRNALQTQANFTIINNAVEAHDGHLNLLPTFDEEIKVELGIATPESAQASQKAINRAMEDFQQNAFDVLVTAPSNTIPADEPQALKILVSDALRVALMTPQIPLKDVVARVTHENVKTAAKTFFTTLKRDFSISNPRIAILALNPKKADGSFGKEEEDIIKPVITELEEEKVQAFGPYAADEFFGNGLYEAFDGVLALYYEQGVTPFKALSPEDGITYISGQTLIRTAVDNEPFEHAGKGITDEMSFRHAIYTAIDTFRNRTNYDIPLENPLKKLYKERKDESEKVRFSVPKKTENSGEKREDNKPVQNA